MLLVAALRSAARLLLRVPLTAVVAQEVERLLQQAEPGWIGNEYGTNPNPNGWIGNEYGTNPNPNPNGWIGNEYGTNPLLVVDALLVGAARCYMLTTRCFAADIVGRNCNHFSSFISEILTGNKIPEYLNRCQSTSRLAAACVLLCAVLCVCCCVQCMCVRCGVHCMLCCAVCCAELC